MGSEFKKQLAEVRKAAEAQGWRVVERKSGITLYPADKSKPGVTVHETPSDHRAWLNFLSQMRRSGFVAD